MIPLKGAQNREMYILSKRKKEVGAQRIRSDAKLKPVTSIVSSKETLRILDTLTTYTSSALNP